MSGADRSPPRLEGRVLDDRYLVKSKLAQGGMGVVYLGRDQRLDQSVVVKVPHPRIFSRPGLRQQFQAEVEQLKAIEHPHVVRILDIGDHEGTPYLVLQHLSGGTLAGRIDRDREAGPREVLDWLRDIAETLDFLHDENGLVHRDIKPSNILFDRYGRPHLADFGIARCVTDEDLAPRGGTVLGSPAFMAPEQLTGGPITGATDQYSLASTVYRALSGRLPHKGSESRMIRAKKREEAVPLSSRLPDLHPAVAAVVMRALARDPAARYGSCGEFAREFEAACAAAGRTVNAAAARRKRAARAAAEEGSDPILVLLAVAAAILGVVVAHL